MAELSTQTTIAEPPLPRRGVLPIYAITPFTMLDFQQKTSCIIWFSGCNMRCGYCHNPQIVKGHGRGNVDDVMKFLHKRQGLLDGVVLSGGEASAYTGIVDFARTVKEMGYAVKLDTNGLRPDIVQILLEQNLVDFVALDYKAPPHKFKRVTGTNKFADFHATLKLLSTNKIPFEVRTTVHTALLNEDDINAIIADLSLHDFRGIYAIQNYRADNNRPTLGRLSPQTRFLNLNDVNQSGLFKIIYRNF